jgi:hypothetical protein
MGQGAGGATAGHTPRQIDYRMKKYGLRRRKDGGNKQAGNSDKK